MDTLKKTTRLLILMTIISFIFCLILNISKIKNEFLEAFLINIATGFFTSALISYVEYTIEIKKEISYFFNEISIFYTIMSRISDCLNSRKSIDEIIKYIINNIDYLEEHSNTKKNRIELEFIVNTTESVRLNEIVNKVYSSTAVLDFLELEYVYINQKNTKDNQKKFIDKVNNLIDLKLTSIDENIKEIDKYDISEKWQILKENIDGKYKDLYSKINNKR